MTIIENIDGGSSEDPPVDQAFLDQVTRLMPFMIDAAKAAVEEAAATTPTTTYRPANVVGVDAALRNASVLCDGDTTPITAQVLTELPGQGDRVMVEFRAAGAVFVAGFITACGTPPGTLAPYAGSISNHAGAVSGTATPGEPPRGWLWCAGQAVSRSTYPALYLAIGDTWGAGDGATTFNVPDFRGREFRGLDNMGGTDAGRISAANTLGGTGGSNTISQAMLPAVNFSVSGGSVSGSVSISDPGHAHATQDVTSATGGAAGGYNMAVLLGYTGGLSTSTETTGITASLSGASYSGGSASSGGSGSEHLPPYALVHIIIKS